MLSEIQTLICIEKDECCMISLISLKCGIKKKTYRKRDYIYGYQRQGVIEGIGRKVVKMYSFQS